MAESMRKVTLAAALAIGLSGCFGGKPVSNDPKIRLQEYISRSFAVDGPEDRQEMLGYLGGTARTRLAAWTDEQFRRAFIEQKRQFVRLAFKEVKPVSPTEVSVTYELTYLDQTRGDARVTHRKLSQMVLENQRWVIAEVRNINELIEYRNEMSLP
jgi:hypothetical protein